MSLSAHAVALAHDERRILDEATLTVAPGVALLAGRNGAGKSTLLRVLAGVEPPDAGRVELDGRAFTAMAAKARARQIALVPQEVDCPFEFSGHELVAMGRYPHLRPLAALSPADHAAIERALRRVDAMSFADQPVTTLSSGELRRIAIARALCTETKVLLLDEPTANLDLEHALALGALLRELAAEGRAVLVATHDLNLMGPFADLVMLLHDGRIVASGPPQQVLTAERVREVFGVDSGPPSGFFPRAFRR